MKITVNIDGDVLKYLDRYNKDIAEVIEFIVNRDYKINMRGMGAKKQFDNKKQEGLLKRVYYYNTKGMEKKPDRAKWIAKWQGDKKFQKIWAKYEKKGFEREYMPTFVEDPYTEKLKVVPFKDRKTVNPSVV